MATSIPPYNLGELIDATVHLIDNPQATVDDLLEIVKGPDFPTGGQILGHEGIRDACRTGRGSIKMRAVAEVEEGPRGERIVVTEMPYQVSVGAVAVKIKDLVDSKVLEGIRDVNDESAGGKTRLVIDLKRDAPGVIVLNNLFKRTPLQTNFPVNTVALVDGVPRTLNLLQALQAYLDHQRDVVTRRSQFRLEKARARAHIVEGLLRAIDMIDEIIALIRGSQDRAEARAGLMAERFEFSEVQANHILDMPLGRLTRLGREELSAELAELQQTIADLEEILRSEERLLTVIKDELFEIKGEFAVARRTELTHDPGALDIEDLIDDEELVVTLSSNGYVKTTSIDEFRTQGRGGRGVRGAQLRDGDFVDQLLTTTAHAYLLFFSNRGKVYRLKAHEIPMKDRTARGTAIINLLPLVPDERIQAIVDTRDYETHRFLLFATKGGQVKKTLMNAYDSSRRDGIIAIKLRQGDELVAVRTTSGNDDVVLTTRKGQGIRFSEDEVRPMGRDAGGVRGIRLRSGDEVVAGAVVRRTGEEAHLLVITSEGYGKRTAPDEFPSHHRGGQGVRAIRLNEKRGSVTAAFMVADDAQIFVISSTGVVIRQAVAQISTQGRDATGVRVMNVEGDAEVAAVAPVLLDDENGDSESEAVIESGGDLAGTADD
jgi:DNA gyrase subunit A